MVQIIIIKKERIEESPLNKGRSMTKSKKSVAAIG